MFIVLISFLFFILAIKIVVADPIEIELSTLNLLNRFTKPVSANANPQW
jgi:hypothetical protein